MKHDWHGIAKQRDEVLVANFGGAEIFKQLDGRLEIRGGTEHEKAQAHDWMRQFLTRRLLTVERLA